MVACGWADNNHDDRPGQSDGSCVCNFGFEALETKPRFLMCGRGVSLLSPEGRCTLVSFFNGERRVNAAGKRGRFLVARI